MQKTAAAATQKTSPTTQKTRALCDRIVAMKKKIEPYTQCWEWVKNDTLLKDEDDIMSPQSLHMQNILTQCHESFRNGLFHFDLLSVDTNSAQKIAYLYIASGCPTHIGNVVWYRYFFETLTRDVFIKMMLYLSTSKTAEQRMGSHHVLIRLVVLVGRRALLPFVLYDKNELRNSSLQTVFNCLFYELIHRKLYVTQDPAFKGVDVLDTTSEISEQQRLTLHDFQDLLHLGWEPSMAVLLEFPFEWLNIVFPLVSKRLFQQVLSIQNFWNNYPLLHFSQCCEKSRTKLHSLVNAECKLFRQCVDDVQHYTAWRAHSKPTWKAHRLLRPTSSWKIYSYGQPFMVTWRYLHPEVRAMMFNLLNKGSPLIREKFTQNVNDAALVELIKPDSLHEFLPSLLHEPSSPWRCHCYKFATNFGAHYPNCLSFAPQTKSFPISPGSRPWFSRPFQQDTVPLILDLIKQYYTYEQNWMMVRSGHIIAVTHLLALCYSKNLNTSTILALLKRYPVITSKMPSLVQDMKQLRSLLSVFNTANVYGISNVAANLLDRYWKQDKVWLSVYTQVQQYWRC